jgi:hypothetical protein
MPKWFDIYNEILINEIYNLNSYFASWSVINKLRFRFKRKRIKENNSFKCFHHKSSSVYDTSRVSTLKQWLQCYNDYAKEF